MASLLTGTKIREYDYSNGPLLPPQAVIAGETADLCYVLTNIFGGGGYQIIKLTITSAASQTVVYDMVVAGKNPPWRFTTCAARALDGSGFYFLVTDLSGNYQIGFYKFIDQSVTFNTVIQGPSGQNLASFVFYKMRIAPGDPGTLIFCGNLTQNNEALAIKTSNWTTFDYSTSNTPCGWVPVNIDSGSAYGWYLPLSGGNPLKPSVLMRFCGKEGFWKEIVAFNNLASGSVEQAFDNWPSSFTGGVLVNHNGFGITAVGDMAQDADGRLYIIIAMNGLTRTEKSGIYCYDLPNDRFYQILLDPSFFTRCMVIHPLNGYIINASNWVVDIYS